MFIIQSILKLQDSGFMKIKLRFRRYDKTRIFQSSLYREYSLKTISPIKAFGDDSPGALGDNNPGDLRQIIEITDLPAFFSAGR